MEKYKSVYEVDGNYYRFQDPNHFSRFLEGKSEISRFTLVVKEYIQVHSKKVKQVQEDGSPL